jgi:hypothetical protein
VIKPEGKDGLSITPDLPVGTEGERRGCCCRRGMNEEDEQSNN